MTEPLDPDAPDEEEIPTPAAPGPDDDTSTDDEDEDEVVTTEGETMTGSPTERPATDE
jgi:hypothetical protein